MKAFWTIVTNNISDGNNKPNIPLLLSDPIGMVIPGELWVLPEGVGAAAHRHLVIGSFAIPSWQTVSKHTHFVFKRGAFTYQRLIHETEVQHAHPDPLLAFFIVFIRCSDADYVTLTSAPYNIRPVVLAQVDQDESGNDIPGELETTVWTVAQRNAWAAAALSNLGITLPPEIDRGSRLIALLLEMSLARRNDYEQGLR